MALVGKPGLLRDPGEGLLGLTKQTLCALETALNDIALRPNPGGLLERAAEVIRAQTGDVGQNGEREIVVEMRFDIVAHPLQPRRRKTLGGRQREMPDKMPRNADAQGRAQAFDQDPIREATFHLLGQGRDDLAQQGIL